MKLNRNIDPAIKFFISIMGLFVIGVTLIQLQHIFIPFVIAYFMFFLFSPLNSFLTSKKIPLAFVMLLDLGIIGFIIFGISSFTIDSFGQLSEQLPEYLNKLNTIVRDAARSLNIKDPYLRNFSIQNIVARFDYKSIAGDLFSGTFSLLGSVLFVLFFFVFIITGHSTVYEAIKKRYVTGKVKPALKKIESRLKTLEEEDNEAAAEYLRSTLIEEKEAREQILENTFKTIIEQIQRYIIAKITVNLLAGVTVFIVLLLFNVDFAIIWGLFLFFLNFIPTIGSAIALILPTLMSLIQFGSLSYSLIICGVIAAIQTLFFNIIEPMIIGKRLNLNPLIILLAVLVWGYIWGIPGMLFSVPLTAIIKIVISNSESKNLEFINDLMSK